VLRPLRAADFDAWHEVRARSREWLETWEPLPEPGSPDPATDPDAFRARCGAWDRQRQFDAAYGFGVFLRAGDRFAGEVSLGNVQRGPFQSAYVGYWIDEAAAGHGYIPEGVVLMLQYAFDDLRLHRIEAAIVPRNAPSRRRHFQATIHCAPQRFGLHHRQAQVVPRMLPSGPIVPPAVFALRAGD